MILVNIVHFFASPYLMIYNSLGKLNLNLEDVGLTLGIGRGRLILDVIIPQSVQTLVEMFTYFFCKFHDHDFCGIFCFNNTDKAPVSYDYAIPTTDAAGSVSFCVTADSGCEYYYENSILYCASLYFSKRNEMICSRKTI